MAVVQRRWTPPELSVLDARRKAGVSAKAIAAELGRTRQSVITRMYIDNRRRHRARQHQEPTRIQIEPQYVAPPPYVLRERVIRYSIPQTSVTQMVCRDPVAGYSALDSKARNLSVQDALEICALYTGKTGEMVALAKAYGVSREAISKILDGSFFERLLPGKVSKRRHFE